MTNCEKVIKGLECCVPIDSTESNCKKCPYGKEYNDGYCQIKMNIDALDLIKEQQRIIEQYHKADGFLDAHGWKWE